MPPRMRSTCAPRTSVAGRAGPRGWPQWFSIAGSPLLSDIERVWPVPFYNIYAVVTPPQRFTVTGSPLLSDIGITIYRERVWPLLFYNIYTVVTPPQWFSIAGSHLLSDIVIAIYCSLYIYIERERERERAI